MKKRFTIGGAVAGLLYGLGIMVFAFAKAPGQPGLPELILQAVIVGVFVCAGGLFGLLVGLLVDLCVRKK